MRERLPWIAVFLLALTWTMALPIFQRADGRWPWLAGAAIVLLTVSRGCGPFAGMGRGTLLLLLVPFLALTGFLPAPYRWATACVSAGVAAEALRRRLPRLAFLSRGFETTGLLWSLQALLFGPLYLFLGNHHAVAGVGRPLAWLLARLWHGAAYADGAIYLPAPEQVYQFTPSWEQLGFLPWAMLMAGGFALLISRRASILRLVTLVLVGVGYLAWRYVLVVLLVAGGKPPQIAWENLPLAVSFVPLIIALVILLPLDATPPAPAHQEMRESARRAAKLRSRQAFALAGFLALLGLGGAFVFHDPGLSQARRMLIDEGHSDWEWTTERFDTTWYGKRSGYNYYSLATWLGYYFRVDIRREELTRELLANYDLLFIKTPTRAFSPAEIEAVRRFVQGGGGLFLDGDHTNVFGTSTYLNELCRPFGLVFRYDSTYDLVTGDLSLWNRPAVVPHPAVRHMPPYLFATSCSLEAPFWYQPVIVGYGLKAMVLDYSQVSFFPEKEGVTDFLFGLVLQAAGVHYGRGRVLAYTDSTCFSNFFMFIAGKPELVLGCLDWLNRRNWLSWLNGVLLAMGLAAAAAAVVLGRRAGPGRWGAFAGGAAVGLLAAFMICRHVDAGAYPPLEPLRPPVTIAFEREHSLYSLPDKSLTRSPEVSYHTFYVWTQRLDFVPRSYDTLEEALAKGRVVVIINPTREFAVAEVDSLYEYMRRGGSILVMSDPRSMSHAANQLVGGIGMTFEPAPVDSSTLRDPAGGEGLKAWHVGSITGGIPLLLREDGKTVMAGVDRGEGRLVAMAAPYVFTDQVMGATGTVPDDEQRRLYNLEYRLIRDVLVGRGPLPGIPSLPTLPAGAAQRSAGGE